MGDPELQGDEKILVRTQGIHVKSISFEAILTSKRIILVDRIKNILPPKEILLATVRSVDTGENAIGDLTITLGVVTRTGGTRQMVLTFPREGGGAFLKERDVWARQIRSHLTPSFEQVIRKVMPGIEARAVKQSMVQQKADATHSAAPKVKKIVEIPREPLQESGPVPEVPEPLPAEEEILGTYCTQCGTKVPEGSGFCNKCGTRIIAPGEPGPAPSVESAEVPEETPVTPEPVATDLSEYETPEPVPETASPAPYEIPGPGFPPALAAAEKPVEPAQGMAAEPLPAKKRFVPKQFSPKTIPLSPLVQKPDPSSSQPRRQKKPLNKKKALLAVGIVVILLIAVVAAVVVLPKIGSLQTSSGENTSTSATTVVTTKASSTGSTPVSDIVIATTTPVTISDTGVTIKVDYIGSFSGSYTANGESTTIKNSGTKVYEITNATGTVSASVKKTDNTATHALTVEIYKDGTLVKSGNTSAAYGDVTVSADV